jgi:class 3 adenylate cyclase
LFSKRRKRERDAIFPGNYIQEVWPKIRELMADDDPDSYFRYVSETERIRSVESPYFILADIDGFSDFCERNRENPDSVVGLLRGFFGLAGSQIHLYGGEVLKFIGDAVFAMAPSEESAWTITRNLSTLYDAQIAQNAVFGTSLVTVVSKPDQILKGFIGAGGAYVDYSYWGAQVNRMFHASKQDEIMPGVVYFVDQEGTARPWERRQPS